jgi:hypothetical protein
VTVTAQAWDEGGADVAGDACDEDLQRLHHADTPTKARRMRDLLLAKGEEIA